MGRISLITQRPLVQIQPNNQEPQGLGRTTPKAFEFLQAQLQPLAAVFEWDHRGRGSYAAFAYPHRLVHREYSFKPASLDEMLGFYQIGFADPEPPETAPRELTAADPLSPTGPADMAPGDKRALHELLPYSGRRTQGGAKDDVYAAWAGRSERGAVAARGGDVVASSRPYPVCGRDMTGRKRPTARARAERRRVGTSRRTETADRAVW